MQNAVHLCEKHSVSLKNLEYLKRTSSYFPFHVHISKHHIEIIVGHSELFSQICDELLVLQILLLQALHRFVIFCKETKFIPWSAKQRKNII